jgi:beta-glucosidase
LLSIRPTADLVRYDATAAKPVVDAGRYEVQVGASSGDIRQRATFTVSD